MAAAARRRSSALGNGLLRLHSHLPLHSDESHLLTLTERLGALEAAAQGRPVVHKDVRSRLRRDVAKRLLVGEPLDSAALPIAHVCSPS